jgi:CTP:molybdopterin cytidylyltransferase MocA/quercetin dioxygenase-like cupin family protein
VNGPPIGAIILAAGSSSRMGSPKQVLKFEGKSLLRRAALAASDAGCRPVVVVLGSQHEEIRPELKGLDLCEVLNESWETGMASSIRVGVEALLQDDSDTAASIILLCDQPHVTAYVLSALASSYRATSQPIIASAYSGSFGVPALFERSLFYELTQLKGAAGAKDVIKRHASEAHFIPFPEGDVDVDTPEEYVRLISRRTFLQSSAAGALLAIPAASAVQPQSIAPKEGQMHMEIKRNHELPSTVGPGDWFTGSVRVEILFQPHPPARAAGASVTFEPGARTAWHTHPLGQTLIITSGVGLVQREGGAIEEVRPGDVVWFPAGEKHWHGATPTKAMTHIAIQEELDGKMVEWMEPVTDAQYQH